MLSLNVGIRFLIEFSSILVLAFLCLMHYLTDVTLAKQFNIDHASNPTINNYVEDAAEQATSTLPHLPPTTIDFLEVNEDIRKHYVKFLPRSLNYGKQTVGTPVMKTVQVQNTRSDEMAVQLISISGSTEHFHCSFFDDKVVPYQGNTSFRVVFLARQEGLVNNTLNIHSSVGSFVYRVSAVGETNPFRVRPLIGARVPLNASFSSLIYIYNPFPTPLQLTEMYTSGGGLHLELPDEEREAPSDLWKVPPYETRPVMKVHFVARTASNHSSYIRIRTNNTDVQLILPVEVEVSSSPGLYTPLDTLDFGVLRSRHDPPKVLPIHVINSATKFIHIQNIVVTPLFEGLSVEKFDGPIKLSPRTSSPFHIADLELDPQQFSCTGLCTGRVLIKTKNNQYKLSIPFVVRIIPGELHFNPSLSHFIINESSTSEIREFVMENRFDSPILVYEIVLPDEAKPYFKLIANEPTMPVLLPPGKSFPLLNLEFTPSTQLSSFSTVFRLMTNYSHFELPLFAYRGQLDLIVPNSPDQTKLDLGMVGLDEKKSSTFVVSNHNPISVQLIYWQSDLTGVSVEFVGTTYGNVTALDEQRVAEQSKNLSRSEATLLKPEHFAVFRVHAQLSDEGSYAGTVTITTPFESLTIPLAFAVVRGSLTASKVYLPRAFPGRVVSAMLQVKSNYTSEIKLKGAFVEPKDERFQIKIPSDEPMTIKPGEDNHVQVLFDASAPCFRKMCYTALDIEKEVGHLWLLGSGPYSDTAYIDRELYRLLRNQWNLYTDSDKSPVVNIRLQVDGFGSFITEAQAQLYWPRIATKTSLRFTSVRIGRSSTKELVVENPADRPILIQALHVSDYHNPDVLLQMMSSTNFHQQWSKGDLETFEKCIRKNNNMTSVFTFTNSSATAATGAFNSNRINEWLGVEPKDNSYTMILPPGARQRLSITFQPKDEKNFTSLLILRNNLTIIDVVMLKGEGGRGLLKIGQMMPNFPDSTLMFEFPEKQLERKCRINSKSSAEKVPSALPLNNGLVIKEKFRATNIGRMGMQIRSFLIDGMPCEGHGFHINHCEPFFLQSNQSFDIEMVYSPDFTTPIANHELTVLVDDDILTNGQKFKLVAAIPQKYLRPCLEMLPRPMWESVIYYMLVAMALLVLLLSIVVAISDAHRITSCSDEEELKSLFKQVESADKADHSKLANSDASKKPTENGHVSTANGKVHHQSQQPSKVRNRKGNKSGAVASGSSAGASKSSFRPSNLIPTGNGHRFVDHSSNTYMSARDDELQDNKNIDWGNMMHKKVLIRQDSTSSEHSQRSSDTSSTSSSRNNIDSSISMSDLKDRYKKSATDSSNEALQLISSAKASNQSDAKQKGRDQIENNNKKANNAKKTGGGSSKSGLKSTKYNEGKSSKLLEKATSVEAASTKSSSESLNYISKLDLDFGSATKARSATLPLTNDSKSTLMQSENVSISQSDMFKSGAAVGLNEFESANGRIGGYNAAISKPSKQTSKHPLLFAKTSFDGAFRGNSAFSKFQDPSPTTMNSHQRESPNNLFFDLAQQRDIWDSPITSFDSEMAMNMIVKQTEEFASHDPSSLNVPMYPRSLLGSGTSRKVIAPPPGLPIPNHQRHDSGSLSNSNLTRLSEDKWEIGEWSNDFVNANAFKLKHQQQQQQQQQNKFTSNMFSTGDPIRDMQFQQAAAKSRNFSRLGAKDFEPRAYKSYKSVYPVGHSLASVISSATTASSAAAVATNKSSLASPTASSSSSTFSPVIGRPNPPTTTATSSMNSSSSSSQAPRLYSSTSSSNGSHFPETFSLQSSLDSPFSLKSSLLADLDWALQPPNLTTQYPASATTSATIGTQSQSSTVSDNKLNSLFANWNSARSSPMESPFDAELNPSKSFLRPGVETATKPKTTCSSSNAIFDFASTETSVWNSPASWATFDKPQTTTSSTAAVRGSGGEKAPNTKWPSPPSSANSTTAVNSNNGDNDDAGIWSPFDGYRLNSSPTSILAAANIAGSSSNNSQEASSLFEGTSSVFELFGKSPWSPLGASLTDTATTSLSCATSSDPLAAAASTINPETFTERFPPNPSPTLSHHSTSSTNSNSSS